MDGMVRIKNLFQISELMKDITTFMAILGNGEIKIRQNDAWAVNYGSSSYNAASSTNDLNLDGSNIPVSAGTYNVILNFSSGTPSITLYQW